MNNKIFQENIANSINSDLVFKKKCLEIVNDIVETIIEGLQNNGIVKIHNFGTFKLKRKKSRLGRNPKTKEEVMINDRYVVTFKASKNILKSINIL